MAEREYVAGDELDQDAKDFLAKEQGGTSEPEPRKDSAALEPDFDPAEAAQAGSEEERQAEEQRKAEETEERRARLMGWSPKDKWKGDPDRWVDAKTFNDRANPAILHERLEKLAKDRERDQAKFEESAARLERMNTRALEKQQAEHAERIKNLQRQKDEQVAEVAAEQGKDAAIRHAGDWDAYIDGERKKAPEPDPATAGVNPREAEKASARDAWLKTRPEYNSDEIYQAAVHATAEKVYQANPNASYAEQLAEVDRRLAASNKFPEIYAKGQSNGQRQGAAPPADARQMDGVRIAPKPKSNYSSRMNAAERRQGERFVKSGLYKDIEAYARELHAND